MPYSVPGVVAPPPPSPAATSPTHSAGRPGHRRSYTFEQEDHGPGAFASLGNLPRRTPPTSTASPRSPNGRRFHFRADEDDGSSSSSDEAPTYMPAYSIQSPSVGVRHAGGDDDDDGPPPPLRLRQAPAFRLTPPTARNPAAAARNSPPRSPQRSPNSSFVNVHPAPRSPQRSPNSSFVNVRPSPLSPVPAPAAASSSAGVPFPSTSSPSSPLPPTPLPVRPGLPGRASSQPVILLANGKPLKSSLKSSRSAPNVPSHHLRARSAPSTPSLSSSPTSPPGTPEGGAHDPAAFAAALDSELAADSPTTPKAVHFPPPEEGLETVLLFKRSARPASVSFPLGLEDETETETETDSGPRWAGAVAAGGKKDGFPFPAVAGSPLNPQGKQKGGAEWRYKLDAPGVPQAKEPESMVLLERVWLEGAGHGEPLASATNNNGSSAKANEGELHLRGTLLVRNAAFEKHVFVRFTMDGWCTTSEVGAKYEAPVPSPDEAGPGWDRFTFSVRLTDYAHSRIVPFAMPFAEEEKKEGGPLRELGRGGVGRGLAGREMVLVARFWAPWVEVGKVGPYVWCDSLVTPGGRADAIPAPHDTTQGRPWAGTGGGGSGEWWDNNKGGDYRFGFKVERVPVSPLPIAPPQPVSVIPFPTTEEPAPVPVPPPVPSSAPAPPVISISASAPQLTSPSQPPANPPPPPPPRTAAAQALAAKLGRLNLRNYAAPKPAAVPLAGLGRAQSLPGMASAPMVDGQLAVSPGEKKAEEKAKEEKAEEGKTTPGSGLYWSWGQTATGTTPAPAPVSPTTTTTSTTPATTAAQDDDDSSSESTGDGETPPTSPLGAAGLLGLPEVQNAKDPEAVPLPPSPPTEVQRPSPPSYSPVSTPDRGTPLVPTGAETTSSLYQAFVKQWCFAGASPGAGMGAPWAGTKVGV